jgi:hypothetical protein
VFQKDVGDGERVSVKIVHEKSGGGERYTRVRDEMRQEPEEQKWSPPCLLPPSILKIPRLVKKKKRQTFVESS